MSTQSVRCAACALAIALPSSAFAQNIRGAELTPQQFQSLPDNAVIEYDGKQSTAGELRARARQQKAALATEIAALDKSQREGEGKRAKFLQDRKAKLDAENAKVATELARLRQSGGIPENVKQETNQLRERSKNAKTDAEKAQIEQRAGELLRQLQGQGIR
jgi:hypothetical protein